MRPQAALGPGVNWRRERNNRRLGAAWSSQADCTPELSRSDALEAYDHLKYPHLILCPSAGQTS